MGIYAGGRDVLCGKVPFSVAIVRTFPMDALSDIVSLLHPHDCVAGGLDAGDAWAIRFERHAGIKCNAVLEGACTLSVEGGGAPIRLEAGDCFILPHGRSFRISARDGRCGADAETIYAPVRHAGTATYGGGGAFFMIGARFLVSGPAAAALLGSMPAVLVVRASRASAAIPWVLHRIAAELRAPRPGAALAVAHLSHVLLIETMRHHLAADAPAAGWMAALADPALAPAMAAIHTEPAHPWTVATLAARAAMSRTSFALRFRRVVGQGPMTYLTRWRMLRAADRLRRTGDPVARIAAEAGYASESAFAQAFRREMGRSPRLYAHEAGEA